MERLEIKSFLPHRDPMLLIDSVDTEVVTEAKGNELTYAVGTYHVRGDEFFCQGHFPNNPVVPGVILCEIMAQSCVVLSREHAVGKITLFTGIDKMRFRQVVHVGDVCEVTAHLINKRGMIFFCEVSLSVGGTLCCRGELSFALA